MLLRVAWLHCIAVYERQEDVNMYNLRSFYHYTIRPAFIYCYHNKEANLIREFII